MAETLKTTFKLRRGTSAEWASKNPVLAQGEPGFEIDTLKLKIGNGQSAYNDLEYINKEADIPTKSYITTQINAAKQETKTFAQTTSDTTKSEMKDYTDQQLSTTFTELKDYVDSLLGAVGSRLDTLIEKAGG